MIHNLGWHLLHLVLGLDWHVAHVLVSTHGALLVAHLLLFHLLVEHVHIRHGLLSSIWLVLWVVSRISRHLMRHHLLVSDLLLLLYVLLVLYQLWEVYFLDEMRELLS